MLLSTEEDEISAMKGRIKPDLTITNGKMELKQLNITPKSKTQLWISVVRIRTKEIGVQSYETRVVIVWFRSHSLLWLVLKALLFQCKAQEYVHTNIRLITTVFDQYLQNFNY